jgi:hypothetical protein
MSPTTALQNLKDQNTAGNFIAAKRRITNFIQANKQSISDKRLSQSAKRKSLQFTATTNA